MNNKILLQIDWGRDQPVIWIPIQRGEVRSDRHTGRLRCGNLNRRAEGGAPAPLANRITKRIE